MEGIRGQKKVINIIRSSLSVSPEKNSQQESNIFKRDDLEAMKMLSL